MNEPRSVLVYVDQIGKVSISEDSLAEHQKTFDALAPSYRDRRSNVESLTLFGMDNSAPVARAVTMPLTFEVEDDFYDIFEIPQWERFLVELDVKGIEIGDSDSVLHYLVSHYSTYAFSSSGRPTLTMLNDVADGLRSTRKVVGEECALDLLIQHIRILADLQERTQEEDRVRSLAEQEERERIAKDTLEASHRAMENWAIGDRGQFRARGGEREGVVVHKTRTKLTFEFTLRSGEMRRSVVPVLDATRLD